MQDAVALALAFALASPVRVAFAHAPTQPGAETQYTYLGLFTVSRCHLSLHLCVARASSSRLSEHALEPQSPTTILERVYHSLSARITP